MELTEPIIIIGAPRSGTTWLKELLTFHKDLWHLPQESHHIFEGPLHPRNFESFSNHPDPGFKLSADQIESIHHSFWKEAVNLDVVPGGERLLNKFRGNRYMRKGLLKVLGQVSKLKKPQPNNVTFLEKTPKNIVRLPTINQIFPDAKYIYIKRNPVENISSIYRGWTIQSSFFYRLLKGRPRFANSGYGLDLLDKFDIQDNFWRFVLPPGYENENFDELLDIAVFQYIKSNKLAEKDFAKLIKPENLFSLTYEALAEKTTEWVNHLLNFSGLSPDRYNYDSLHEMPRINTAGSNSRFQDLASRIKQKLPAQISGFLF